MGASIVEPGDIGPRDLTIGSDVGMAPRSWLICRDKARQRLGSTNEFLPPIG